GAQWRIGSGQPPQPDGPLCVELPWTPAPARPPAVPNIAPQKLELPRFGQEVPDPAFAEELFLQKNLDSSEELRRNVTIQRLLDLYEPDLVTDRVDVDANDEAWIALLRNGQRRFYALTSGDVLKTLVPRDSLVAALVARLAAQDGRQ